MTYRLAGALALPGHDREFLRQVALSLRTALPDAGFIQVLGLGGEARPEAGPCEAALKSLLADCGFAALLLPASASQEGRGAAVAGPDSPRGDAAPAGARLASLASDGFIAYRAVVRSDGAEGPARALAEAARPWPALPGPLPRNAAGEPSWPIVLVGPMASGKTSLGTLLARRAGAEFIDLDALVEARAGLSVARIFESEGEAGFRLRESAALEEAMDRAMPGPGLPGAVIATGGGAVLAERNRALLAARARVVWLHAGASVLAARAAAEEALQGPRRGIDPGPRRGIDPGQRRGIDPVPRSGLDPGPRRPLLSCADPLARLSALQRERLPFYASVASFLLPVEGRAADVLAEVLHDALL